MTSQAMTTAKGLLLPKDPAVRRNLRITEALPYFLTYRQAVDKSKPNTMRLDRQSLMALVRALGDLQVRSVSTAHIDDFFIIRSDAGLSGHGLNSDLRALRMFFKWAQARDIRRTNPIIGRKMFNVERRQRLHLPISEFRPLLEASRNRRDRMVVALGLYLWQRQGEVGMIKISDITLDHEARGGYIDVKIPKTTDFDRMPISLRLYEELCGWADEETFEWHEGYLEYYKRVLEVEELSPEWYLVPQLSRGLWGTKNVDGTQIKCENIPRPLFQYNKVHEASKRALVALGYDGLQEGGHTLRRSGARAYYDLLLASNGHEGAIRTIMSMLHHRSMRTTEIYLGVDADRAVRNKAIMGVDMYGEKKVPMPEPQQIPEDVPQGNVISVDFRRRIVS